MSKLQSALAYFGIFLIFLICAIGDLIQLYCLSILCIDFKFGFWIIQAIVDSIVILHCYKFGEYHISSENYLPLISVFFVIIVNVFLFDPMHLPLSITECLRKILSICTIVHQCIRARFFIRKVELNENSQNGPKKILAFLVPFNGFLGLVSQFTWMLKTTHRFNKFNEKFEHSPTGFIDTIVIPLGVVIFYWDFSWLSFKIFNEKNQSQSQSQSQDDSYKIMGNNTQVNETELPSCVDWWVIVFCITSTAFVLYPPSETSLLFVISFDGMILLFLVVIFFPSCKNWVLKEFTPIQWAKLLICCLGSIATHTLMIIYPEEKYHTFDRIDNGIELAITIVLLGCTMFKENNTSFLKYKIWLAVTIWIQALIEECWHFSELENLSPSQKLIFILFGIYTKYLVFIVETTIHEHPKWHSHKKISDLSENSSPLHPKDQEAYV